VAAVAGAVLTLVCASAAGGSRAAPAVLLAAGDIATCKRQDDERTAELLARHRGTIAALGDLAYESGTPREFSACYAPSWGRFVERTRPAVGNHEYATPGAAGYFDYFGKRAGPRGKGWYSYELGSWHIVVLNSNCSQVGGCHHGTPQERWLKRDLAQHRTRCTLAYMHHPRFSSGMHGDSESQTPLWQVLYAAGADLVLAGHDHDYERFAPMTPLGQPHRARGIRQFVVGTGGKSLREFEETSRGSEVRQSRAFGVLKLTLFPTRYEWQFLPTETGAFADRGSAACH
jgi:hypothetical protein